jgi:REP element-mobilizing transposase RayT
LPSATSKVDRFNVAALYNMPNPHPLEPGVTYHVFNRGTNGEDLFRTDGQFAFFLALYTRHVQPACETLAYCLMPNHIHLAIRVRHRSISQNATEMPRRGGSQALSNLFNAYAKSINLTTGRTGSLFEHPFHRKPVHDPASLSRVIRYIHLNPQRHEFVNDFRSWPWSSYAALIGTGATWLNRDLAQGAFGNVAIFEAAHLAVALGKPVNL